LGGSSGRRSPGDNVTGVVPAVVDAVVADVDGPRAVVVVVRSVDAAVVVDASVVVGLDVPDVVPGAAVSPSSSPLHATATVIKLATDSAASAVDRRVVRSTRSPNLR
jgi:hypothetical protein